MTISTTIKQAVAGLLSSSSNRYRECKQCGREVEHGESRCRNCGSGEIAEYEF